VISRLANVAAAGRLSDNGISGLHTSRMPFHE
jgi:hypothetical protein